MNLTSLLVCSDDRALRVLCSVLGELEIDVEHCADHMSAAKELAQRTFEAVQQQAVAEKAKQEAAQKKAAQQAAAEKAQQEAAQQHENPK